MLKIIVTFVLTTASFLAILMALNTVASRQRRFGWDMSREDVKSFQLDRERIGLRAERLAKSLTIKTISWDRDVFETEALLDLHQHLKTSNHRELRAIYYFELEMEKNKYFRLFLKKQQKHLQVSH